MQRWPTPLVQFELSRARQSKSIIKLDADIMIHLLGLGWPRFVCVKYALSCLWMKKRKELMKKHQRGDVTMPPIIGKMLMEWRKGCIAMIWYYIAQALCNYFRLRFRTLDFFVFRNLLEKQCGRSLVCHEKNFPATGLYSDSLYLLSSHYMIIWGERGRKRERTVVCIGHVQAFRTILLLEIEI